MKLTPEQHSFFHEHGYLRLERAIAREQLRPLQTRIADNLRRHGIGPSGRGMPRSIRDLPAFQQIVNLSKLGTAPELEAKVIPPQITQSIEELAHLRVASSQTQLLLSPLKQGAWSLDALNWHTDIASSAGNAIPGIQAFVVVQDLEIRGGATLVLSGSHLQMTNSRASACIREALRKGREGEATLRELNLSIAEFHGKAGDVYLMDMRALHTPSINTSDRLRIVVTVRFFFG